MNRDSTYDIHLDSLHNTLRIGHEGYLAILEIARKHAVCSRCYEPYGEDNPMIAGTECLSCFQKREKLTYLGVIPNDDSGYSGSQSAYNPFPVVLHLHMKEADGWLYETNAGPGQSRDATRENVRTLRYWGYPVPQKAQLNNKEVSTKNTYWSVNGDVRTDDVLMLEHGSRAYSNEILFLVQRNGQLVQINRRKAAHRQLLEVAGQELEKYRDARGKYTLWGEQREGILDGDIYRIAASLAQEHHIFTPMADIIQPTLEQAS